MYQFYIYVYPQMVANSISEWGIPTWDFLKLPARLHTGIAIWKQWIIWENIPIWGFSCQSPNGPQIYFRKG